jgi:4-aminobutyrate aminotransferase-like enzyme
LIVNAVDPSTIRLVPPLTVTDDEIDEAVDLLSAAIGRALAGVDA